MTTYLETKVKRVIRCTNNSVETYLAYKMAEDFSHCIVAIAKRHPDDDNDLSIARRVAKEKADAGVLSSTCILVTGSDIEKVIEDFPIDLEFLFKSNKLLLETGLKYVAIRQVFNYAYTKFFPKNYWNYR